MGSVTSIAPGSDARIGLLVARAATKLSACADHVACPVQRAKLKARAEALRKKGKELVHE